MLHVAECFFHPQQIKIHYCKFNFFVWLRVCVCVCVCVCTAQRAVEKVVVAHQRIQRKAANGGTDDRLLAQQSDIVNTVTNLLNQTGEV